MPMQRPLVGDLRRRVTLMKWDDTPSADGGISNPILKLLLYGQMSSPLQDQFFMAQSRYRKM